MALILKDDVARPPDETSRVFGVVKWFDATKGFGFVQVPGFEVDFLLHRSTLLNYGCESIISGSPIEFRYAAASGRLRVSELVSINDRGCIADSEDIEQADNASEDWLPARVKWFDTLKGYGFVNCFGGSEDIFIGFRVLNDYGLQNLTSGQALSVRYIEFDGGKRVDQIHNWLVE